jgi:hypothetical protein
VRQPLHIRRTSTHTHTHARAHPVRSRRLPAPPSAQRRGPANPRAGSSTPDHDDTHAHSTLTIRCCVRHECTYHRNTVIELAGLCATRHCAQHVVHRVPEHVPLVAAHKRRSQLVQSHHRHVPRTHTAITLPARRQPTCAARPVLCTRWRARVVSLRVPRTRARAACVSARHRTQTKHTCARSHTETPTLTAAPAARHRAARQATDPTPGTQHEASR